jgi:DNA-binding transcriptional LysR family regulator
MDRIILILPVHITDLDFNLIKAFDALLRTLNVTQAAQSLNLSQPAMSHALRRLRTQFDDPLFVRTSHGMQPTPFALGLSERLQAAIGLINECLAESAPFRPELAQRTFTLFITDIGDIVFLPAMLAHFKQHAPQARIRTLGFPFKDVGRCLESGEVDIAITVLPVLKSGFYQQMLFRERYVCIARADHPDFTDGITERQFRSAAHALVTAEGTGHEVIEKSLAKHGLTANIVLRLPHFLAAPAVVAKTDLIAVVPRRLALATAESYAIRIFEQPLRLPAYGVKQFWHARFNADPAHRWLRQVMKQLFGEPARKSGASESLSSAQ